MGCSGCTTLCTTFIVMWCNFCTAIAFKWCSGCTTFRIIILIQSIIAYRDNGAVFAPLASNLSACFEFVQYSDDCVS